VIVTGCPKIQSADFGGVETQLAASRNTLLIDKFILTINALELTIRADALNTVWWQFGLLLGNQIRQGFAYFGMREDPLAVLAGESPPRHAGLLPPVTDLGIPRLVYSSRFELEIVDCERAAESQMVIHKLSWVKEDSRTERSHSATIPCPESDHQAAQSSQYQVRRFWVVRVKWGFSNFD
jgi:hypothetical protein